MITTILSDIGNVVAFYDNDKAMECLAVLSGTTKIMARSAVFDGDPSVFTRFMTGEFDRHDFRRLVCERMAMAEPIPADLFDEGFGDVFTINKHVCAEWNSQRARGRKIVAVSNMEPIRYEWLQRMGVDTLFDHVLLSCDEKMVKPSQRLLIRALDRAGAKPWNSVFIDDQAKNMPPAEQIGINCHLYKDAEGLAAFLKEVGLND